MRQHMKSLEHKTDMLAPHARQCSVAERTQILPKQQHLAAVPAIEPGHAIEQGGFTHTRVAHDGNEFARLHA